MAATDLVEQVASGTMPDGSTLKVDQEFLKKAADLGKSRLDRYKLFEEYYDGAQQVKLPDRMKQYLERAGVEWSENFCETIVDAAADRVAVAGFSTNQTEREDEEDPSTENDELADWLQEYVWEKNRMDAGQHPVHFTAFQKGDSFLLVDWDNDKGCPRLTFNRPEIIKPVWDDDGHMLYVVKVWNTNGKALTNPNGKALQRMNIYYPDRVEKFFRLSNDAGKWSIHLDDDDQTWPTPWKDADGEPMGIPVFHFPNKPQGRHWGRSELRNAVSQQNVLNKQVLDMLAVQDTQGWPQRYAVGVENADQLKTAPGEVWTTTSPTASFGQFETAPLDGALNAIEKTLLRMAARSRTPVHLLLMTSGGAPSGESLKAAETGLTRKADHATTVWGGVWSDVLVMCVKLALTYKEAEQKPPVQDIAGLTIDVKWEPTETVIMSALLEGLRIMKELGVSEHTILSMIPGIDANQEQEQGEIDQERAAEDMMAYIDRGANGKQPKTPMSQFQQQRQPAPTGG